MPALEGMGRHQKAVLWEKTGVDRYGETVRATPVELDVRWEEGSTDMLLPDGTKVKLEGVVVTNRAVPEGSLMWLAPNAALSPLEQWYGTGSAGDDSGVMMVHSKDTAPDLKGRNVRYELNMVKYRDTLPDEGS